MSFVIGQNGIVEYIGFTMFTPFELKTTLEQFPTECRKTKPRVITLASHKEHRERVTIVFQLVSFLIGRESSGVFRLITDKRSNAKPKLTQITVSTQVEATLSLNACFPHLASR